MKSFLLLLVATMATTAAPSDPGRAAVDFLEKVRLRKLDLEPGGDTALSPQTAAGKKSQIARNLERMARDLGSDPLEVSAVKLDENFAAVLVRKMGGFDPLRLQIFPIALVKRDSQWTVAPVPASFENSGTGYASELRKRLEKLETWMLREQIVTLEQLREQSVARMREKIELSLPTKVVRQMTAETFGDGFLDACARRDLPAMLGFLGGLGKKLPDDWPARLKSVEQAVAHGNAVVQPWRLLTSPDVARVVVAREDDGLNAWISVACLDPAGVGTEVTLPQFEMIHLELAKDDDGIWQMNLPENFLTSDAESDEESDDSLDAELRDAFAAKWIAKNPLQPHASAELAQQAMTALLGNGNFPAILSFSKIDGEPATARNNCIQAAQLCRSIQNSSSANHAVPLALRSTENAAVGLFQFFTARDPEKFKPTPLYFEKSAIGWLWAPIPTPETVAQFREWVSSETVAWRGQWQNLILENCPVIDPDNSLPAPTQEAAQALAEKWLETIRKGDVKAALKLVAKLDHPQSGATVLQNLGYEITSARRSTAESTIAGLYSGKIWTAVGVKTHQAGGPTFPFYPIIQTPQGPRILIEIDLFAPKNPGREFLNKAAFERLEKQTNAAGELHRLFAEYQASVGKPTTPKQH